MKSKISTYIILIISALLLAVILVSRNRSPFGKKNTSFASLPEKEITRIEFEQGKKKLTLEKGEEEWLMNNSVPARKSSISFILRILLEMKIKSPVSEETIDSVVNSVEPVRVRIFEDGERINSFLVYKTRTNVYGNIMKTSERAKPFIVHVPGQDNDIGSAFTLNELYWQPYTIFNLLPSEIERIELENGNDSSASFSLLRVNDHFSLYSGERELAGWDTSLVKRYVSYFTFIPFESWVLDIGEAEKRRMTEGVPAYTLKITSRKGKPVFLRLWQIKRDEGSVDTDRLYGKTQFSDEIFIVRYFDIDPVLKKRDYFFSKE